MLRFPGSLLLNDHAPFLVYLDRVACHEMGVVMHNQQAGVHNACPRYRNVVEHICGLLYARGCVDVASEFRPYALQIVQYLLVRKVLGAVEAHVLEEVGETVLVRSLLDGAYICRQVELRPAFRPVVVPDIVGEPVVQLSFADGRIVRQLLDLRLLSEDNGCGEQRSDECKDTFHDKLLYVCQYFQIPLVPRWGLPFAPVFSRTGGYSIKIGPNLTKIGIIWIWYRILLTNLHESVRINATRNKRRREP